MVTSLKPKVDGIYYVENSLQPLNYYSSQLQRYLYFSFKKDTVSG